MLMPSVAMASKTTGFTSATGVEPPEYAAKPGPAKCDAKAADIWLRPALCPHKKSAPGTVLSGAPAAAASLAQSSTTMPGAIIAAADIAVRAATRSSDASRMSANRMAHQADVTPFSPSLDTESSTNPMIYTWYPYARARIHMRCGVRPVLLPNGRCANARHVQARAHPADAPHNSLESQRTWPCVKRGDHLTTSSVTAPCGSLAVAASPSCVGLSALAGGCAPSPGSHMGTGAAAADAASDPDRPSCHPDIMRARGRDFEHALQQTSVSVCALQCTRHNGGARHCTHLASCVAHRRRAIGWRL